MNMKRDGKISLAKDITAAFLSVAAIGGLSFVAAQSTVAALPGSIPSTSQIQGPFNVAGANGKTQDQVSMRLVDNGTVSPERREALHQAYLEQQGLGRDCAVFGPKPVLICVPKGLPPIPQILRRQQIIIDPPVP